MILKTNFFNCGFSTKVTCAFPYLQENIKELSLLNTFKAEKQKYQISFKGTVENWALPF